MELKLLARGTPVSVRLVTKRPLQPPSNYGLSGGFKTRRLSTPADVQALRNETIEVNQVGAYLDLTSFHGPWSQGSQGLGCHVNLSLGIFDVE